MKTLVVRFNESSCTRQGLKKKTVLNNKLEKMILKLIIASSNKCNFEFSIFNKVHIDNFLFILFLTSIYVRYSIMHFISGSCTIPTIFYYIQLPSF
jgi:hypothetical protein